MATCVVLNEVVVWPLVALVQRAWGRRLLRSLHRDIQAHSEHFKAYFQCEGFESTMCHPPLTTASLVYSFAVGGAL